MRVDTKEGRPQALLSWATIMTETANGTAVPASAGSLAKVAEASSRRPSVAATSRSEGQGSPEPAEKPRGSLVPPAPASTASAAAAGTTAEAAAAAAAAAKTPIRGTVVGRIKAPPTATASMQRQAFSAAEFFLVPSDASCPKDKMHCSRCFVLISSFFGNIEHFPGQKETPPPQRNSTTHL